jgi:hypothetical protein
MTSVESRFGRFSLVGSIEVYIKRNTTKLLNSPLKL